MVLALVLATKELPYLAVQAGLGNHPQVLVVQEVTGVIGGRMVAMEAIAPLAVQPGVLEVRQAQPSLVTQTLLGKALELG